MNESLVKLVSQNVDMRCFLLRLLHPEEFGYAVTQDVRDEARRLLGLPPTEFSEAAAKEYRT